jgi:hypothetical protein
MPSFYIANCTKQERMFCYSLPENMRPFVQMIRAGAQVKIDMPQDHIDSIISQHEPYGFVEAKKVSKSFAGYCYSINKPVSLEAIEAGILQTENAAVDRAADMREIGAIVTDSMIANKAQEMGMTQKGLTEVEITEQPKGPSDNRELISETIEVPKEGIAPRRGRPRKSS